MVEACEGFHDPLDGGDIVFREEAAIGSGVGEDLVAFVEGLGDLESAAGGEAEFVTGFALETGEVEEERAAFLFGFAGVLDGGGFA